ncbi:hypothetical protein CB0940_06879 [Cercospora beticola]|uniref:Uncharacterized protein n=1 Tax=Cercospora beticola TaxID=122368 RepID=A0A2G5HAB3_CERBT|nr:hypothetical protein CB0940_06879 [Cercospora beticola]PIA89233.1 hypothetical protein CB0940_06879 [Cercospora beticola]
MPCGLRSRRPFESGRSRTKGYNHDVSVQINESRVINKSSDVVPVPGAAQRPELQHYTGYEASLQNALAAFRPHKPRPGHEMPELYFNKGDHCAAMAWELVSSTDSIEDKIKADNLAFPCHCHGLECLTVPCESSEPTCAGYDKGVSHHSLNPDAVRTVYMLPMRQQHSSARRAQQHMVAAPLNSSVDGPVSMIREASSYTTNWWPKPLHAMCACGHALGRQLQDAKGSCELDPAVVYPVLASYDTHDLCVNCLVVLEEKFCCEYVNLSLFSWLKFGKQLAVLETLSKICCASMSSSWNGRSMLMMREAPIESMLRICCGSIRLFGTLSSP